MSENTEMRMQDDMATASEAAPSPAAMLQDAASQEALGRLLEKVMPLVMAGRMNNLVDLLSLVSDLVEFMDEASLEKTTKAGEELLAAGWAVSNAVRLAQTTTAARKEAPGLLALSRQLNDPDIRRGISFLLETLRLLGQQMRHDPLDDSEYA